MLNLLHINELEVLTPKNVKTVRYQQVIQKYDFR